MSDRMHALAQGLTGKETLDDCSIEEVQEIAQRHPYFAPAQFLLLQKLRQAGKTEEAEAQYRKAVLYFHDPLLFEHFISSHTLNEDDILLSSSAKANDFTESEEGTQTLFPETIEAHNSASANDDSKAEVIDEEVAEPVNVISDDLQNKTAQVELIPSASDEEVSLAVEDDYRNNTRADNNQEETKDEPQISFPAFKPITTETTKVDLTFEPFHTVDYFASQGIKISQEEAPKDKLGKQMKSFTEWLKTMKRLPATQITETLESSAEKKVESMASHSVSESDVVTEAMAEVWLKQGKTEKALDIYNKLSLQNPSKRAYFAAKIENLKQS